jgi:hypothetical protein
MIKQFYNHLGLTFIRQESGKNGPELIFECPWCKTKAFSVNAVTGAWQCFKGCGNGYPYQIAIKLTNLDPKPVFELLEQFGLGKDNPDAVRTQRAKPTKPKLTSNDVTKLTDADIKTFCEAKGVDRDAFLRVRPCRHKTKPWILLPAFDPADMKKATGWIRAGIDGSLIPIRYKEDGVWHEKLEKYPVIAGSNVGLLGLHAIDPMDDVIIFAEGWKDMLAAMKYGYNSVACNMGAGKWRDTWKTVFKNKKVYVIFDADAAGVAGAAKVAEKIYEVAQWVRVVKLPYKVKEKGGLDLFDLLNGVRE